MLISSFELTKKCGGGSRTTTSRARCRVVYAVGAGHKTKDGKAKKQVALYIGASWLEMVGFKVGDRVDFLFDPVKRTGVILKRRDEKGYKISTAGKQRARISFTWREGMPFVDSAVDMESLQVDGDALKFVVPAQCFDAQRRLRGVG